MGSPSLPSLHLFSEPDVLGVASGLGPDVLAAVATAMIDKKYATIDHIRAALCSTSVPPLTVFHLQDMLEQSLLTRVFALLREVSGCKCTQALHP